MKRKIFAILSIVMVICMITAIGASANRNFTTGIGGISVTKGSPTVDGNITDGEGWTGPINFDKRNYATAWASHSSYEWSGGLYFASDDNGFYFAAMMNDNFDLFVMNEVQDENGNWYYEDQTTFKNETIISTMDVSATDTDGHGFDGDTFILQLDPQTWFLKNGYTENSDFTAWYNISLFSETSAKMVRTKWNVGEVPGAVVGGQKTASGWCFEAYIPWSEIANDCSAASGGDWNPTAAELAAASQGSIVKDGIVSNRYDDCTWTSAEVIYVDRYNDLDTGEVGTWMRYCTVPGVHPTGAGTGMDGDGVSVKLTGIYLKLGADQGGAIPNTGGDAINVSNQTTNTDGSVDTSTSANTNTSTNTNTNTNTNKSTSGNGSAQTFDPGIAIALVTAGAAGAGFVFTKKKFK